MKIRFLSGPRTGQIDHSPNSQEMQLLAKAGIIEIIPYRDFRERLAAEATSQTAGSFQNVSVDEEWGFDGSCTQFRQPVIIFKRGSETLIYDGPTKNCPATIASQFRDATQPIVNPEWAEELRERERNKQLEQQRKERQAMRVIVNSPK
jgi:hypothetical protein